MPFRENGSSYTLLTRMLVSSAGSVKKYAALMPSSENRKEE
jgi:hypothetical protein